MPTVYWHPIQELDLSSMKISRICQPFHQPNLLLLLRFTNNSKYKQWLLTYTLHRLHTTFSSIISRYYIDWWHKFAVIGSHLRLGVPSSSSSPSFCKVTSGITSSPHKYFFNSATDLRWFNSFQTMSKFVHKPNTAPLRALLWGAANVEFSPVITIWYRPTWK